ncbi:hypothetical protein [uncultured Acinetobacter sp.]|uniref:hypothetical protein n=1 Tax=uncultured Acinetobacter sp. TaxID=165433 RepID=UPI00259018FD|nr:hypothetical protein [uncultured Acinetobacter sp.]
MAMKLMPIAGMNNVSPDDALQRGGDAPKLFVREALNVDISETGRISLRKGEVKVSELKFKNIWQSPLHHDVFATLNQQLVRINPSTWSYDVLLDGVDDSIVCYEVVNNIVFISTMQGIYCYNGVLLMPLTIDTPASPRVVANDQGGSLGTGDYIVAISYVRNGMESALSENVHCNVSIDGQGDPLQGSMTITLPYCLDGTVTGVNIYVTSRNGAELKKFGTYPISTLSVVIDQCEKLGRAVQFNNLSPMLSGKFMQYWQGRILTADKNIIRFSQAMAYHLHDERHDFVMMPQRITFVLAVDAGIWVGQVDHVVFLSGSQPSEMAFIRKTAHAPIHSSAIIVDTDTVGGDISQGGGKTALWLSENGYVLGTSTGQVIELHAGTLKGITAKSGRSVRLGRRIVTLVT